MTSLASRLSQGFAALAATAIAGIALAQAPAAAPGATTPATTTPNPATTATTPATTTTAPETAATAAAPHGACTECGVVKSVTAIENKVRPTGKGAVAGGVVGGVIGHQLGSGRGNTAATIAGAGAGAYAGHKIEEKRGRRQYWSVVVMMDDGSTRKLTYKSKPQFREGDRVSMDNPGHHVTQVAD